MTLEELEAKRDEIIASIGLTGMSADGLSEQYGDPVKALAAINAEIDRLTVIASPSTVSRTTYASFRND